MPTPVIGLRPRRLASDSHANEREFTILFFFTHWPEMIWSWLGIHDSYRHGTRGANGCHATLIPVWLRWIDRRTKRIYTSRSRSRSRLARLEWIKKRIYTGRPISMSNFALGSIVGSVASPASLTAASMRLLKISRSPWWAYAVCLGWVSTQARFLPARQEIGQSVTTVDAADPTSKIPSASSTLEPASASMTYFATSALSSSTTSAAFAALTNGSSGSGGDRGDNWPVKYYDLTFTWGEVDSNGEPRQAILVNGQTPGPLIEIEEGQQVSVSGIEL